MNHSKHNPAEYPRPTNPENTQRKYESWRKKASVQEQYAIDYFSEILDEFGEELITDNVVIDDRHYSLDDTNMNSTHSNGNTESTINLEGNNLTKAPSIEENLLANLLISQHGVGQCSKMSDAPALKNSIKECEIGGQPRSIDCYRMNYPSNSIANPETWRKRASEQEQYAIDYFSEILDAFSTDSMTDSDSIFGTEDHRDIRESDSNINTSIDDKIESLLLPSSQAKIQSGKRIKNSQNKHCMNCTDSQLSSSIKKSSFHPKTGNIDSDKLNISSTTIAKIESWRKKANEQEQCAIDFFSEVLSEFTEESNKDNLLSTDNGNPLNNRTLENSSRAEIHPSININRPESEYNPLDKQHSSSQSVEYVETLDHVAKSRDRSPSKGEAKKKSSSCGSPNRTPRNEYKIELYMTTDIPESVRIKSDSKKTIDQIASEMANIKSSENERNEGKHLELQNDVSVDKLNKRKEKHKLVYSTVRSVGPKQKSNLRPMAGLSRSSLLS